MSYKTVKTLNEDAAAQIRDRYRRAKVKAGLTDKKVAAMFGYSDARSFHNASRKIFIQQGVASLILSSKGSPSRRSSKR